MGGSIHFSLFKAIDYMNTMRFDECKKSAFTFCLIPQTMRNVSHPEDIILAKQ
ncbi:unnamed protein product [Debaryomyces tyrocola]|nr:unnamed protein product [Debaryomyces tyrocola]